MPPVIQSISTPLGDVQVHAATPNDLPRALTLFDDAVAWLVARGIPGQWGTEPFSSLPHMHRRFAGWIDRGDLYLFELGDELVGSVAVSEVVPAYAAEACQGLPRPSRYLEAFTTSRRLAGTGLGAAILRWAEAHAGSDGAVYMRLDCWSGNPELIAYYERQGYVPVKELSMGAWRGRLFEKRLAPVGC
jgi:GNAT superfamily N-acetyltransferase